MCRGGLVLPSLARGGLIAPERVQRIDLGPIPRSLQGAYPGAPPRSNVERSYKKAGGVWCSERGARARPSRREQIVAPPGQTTRPSSHNKTASKQRLRCQCTLSGRSGKFQPGVTRSAWSTSSAQRNRFWCLCLLRRYRPQVTPHSRYRAEAGSAGQTRWGRTSRSEKHRRGYRADESV